MSEFNWLWNVTKLRHLGDTIQCESKHLGANWNSDYAMPFSKLKAAQLKKNEQLWMINQNYRQKKFPINVCDAECGES